MLSAEVRQHEQTKVESASKFPVRFHGLVLFNAFVNEGVVDQPDLPTSALERAPGQSHGSAGAGLRQTMLSFEGTGPTLWKGHLFADASMDFFGGMTAGSLSAPAGLVRMRTAGISWEWANDLLRAGYDGPLISPLSPIPWRTWRSLPWHGRVICGCGRRSCAGNIESRWRKTGRPVSNSDCTIRLTVSITQTQLMAR